MAKNDYVIHVCKNPNCNNCWVDKDLTNAKTNPPKWKYCAECCKKYGYINPEFPPPRKNKKQRMEQLKPFKKEKEV